MNNPSPTGNRLRSYAGNPDPAGSEPQHFIRELFTGIVPTYDLLNHLLSLGLDRVWRRRAAEYADLKPGEKALDVCTGTGDLAAELARRVGEKGEVWGVDLVSKMLERAREKYPADHFPQLKFREGDALALPISEGAFSVITMAFGLRNLQDLEAFFQEAMRVLTPGGRLLCLELTRPRHWPLSWLYRPVLHGVVPALGWLVSQRAGAYRYLAESIAAFIPPEQVMTLMTKAGFEPTQAIPLNGGIVTIMLGRKPAREASTPEGNGKETR